LLGRHPLVKTLLSLRGNPRACVYTEPLWGIPYSLYSPYASVYMLALGVGDARIGLIASVGLAFSTVCALVGGAITDKLGRRRTTLLFDLVSWSLPCLFWASSTGFAMFLLAAIVNSLYRIPQTSWTCQLVEDADETQLVPIFTWVYVAGLLSAFFSPLAGLLVQRYSLVPTVRGLYVLAFVMMTAKFVVLYRTSSETRRGIERMAETRGKPLSSLLVGYGAVLRQILRRRETLVTLGIMVVMSICLMITTTFWSIYVTQKLAIPAEHIAIFPFARSVVMLVVIFVVAPRLRSTRLRMPLLAGCLGLILSQSLLVIMPPRSYVLLLVSVALEACSVALLNPLIDSLVTLTVSVRERARVMAILTTIVVVVTSPFGFIAGQLSRMNRTLPFALDIVLFSIGALLVLRVERSPEKNG
jgi:MFS family permease